MIIDPNTGAFVGPVDLSPEQITSLMAQELLTCTQPLILGPIAPLEALQLAGLLQLALRHPGISAELASIAGDVVETVRAYFADKPTVLHVLALGDDPAEDLAT